MIRYMHRRNPVEAMKYTKKNEKQIVEWLTSRKADCISSAFINGLFVWTKERDVAIGFKNQEIVTSGYWIVVGKDFVSVMNQKEFTFNYELEKSDAT